MISVTKNQVGSGNPNIFSPPSKQKRSFVFFMASHRPTVLNNRSITDKHTNCLIYYILWYSTYIYNQIKNILHFETKICSALSILIMQGNTLKYLSCVSKHNTSIIGRTAAAGVSTGGRGCVVSFVHIFSFLPAPIRNQFFARQTEKPLSSKLLQTIIDKEYVHEDVFN